MALQIFAFPKCKASARAQRFFKERRMDFQLIDLSRKAMSRGELETVARAVGADKLIDASSPAYEARGLAWMDYDPVEEVLRDMKLLQTPVVRDGNRACVGDDPASWKTFLS